MLLVRHFWGQNSWLHYRIRTNNYCPIVVVMMIIWMYHTLQIAEYTWWQPDSQEGPVRDQCMKVEDQWIQLFFWDFSSPTFLVFVFLYHLDSVFVFVFSFLFGHLFFQFSVSKVHWELQREWKLWEEDLSAFKKISINQNLWSNYERKSAHLSFAHPSTGERKIPRRIGEHM